MIRTLRWINAAAVAAIMVHLVCVAVPWWRALPDLPLAVSLARCPGASVTLSSDAPMLPVVLADSPDGVIGPESDAGKQSCTRLVSAMRAEVPALHLVWSGWLCRSVRAHVMDAVEDADLWAGPMLWVVDGKAVGGRAMYEALTERGLAYVVVNRRLAIVSQ